MLRPCPDCRRHVAVEAVACPFCAAALPTAIPRPISRRRFKRAALFAGAALVSPACSGAAKQSDPQHAQQTERTQQVTEEKATEEKATEEKATEQQASEQTTQTTAEQQTTTEQTAEQKQPPAPAATATLHGRVSDSRTGQALGFWSVTISGPNMQPVTVQTNDRGRYTVKLPPGDYRVQLDSNHPRRTGPMRSVTLKDKANVRLDLAMTFPDPSSVPMPYGAPPARIRIV